MEKVIPLESYFFKKKRLENHYTLKQLSLLTDMDDSYLNKIEKQKIIPSSRRLKKLLHTYSIKEYFFSYCSFSTDYIFSVMKKFYSMTFSKKDLTLLQNLLKEHEDSIYVAHLDLLLSCYKMLYFSIEKDFNKKLNLIFEFLQSFEPEEQEFFLLCEMFYHARRREELEYKKCLEMLNDYPIHSWDGLKSYILLNASFYFNDYENILDNISECKNIFQKENNTGRYNATLLYEAMFYHKINYVDKAINIYKNLSSRYLKLNDIQNFSVIQHNIASLYSEKKQYQLAIHHYIKALEIIHENDTFFELAWCYYCLGMKNECKKTLTMGMKTETQYGAYSLLSDWLMLMLDNPNSKRGLNILLKIEKEYFNSLGPNAQKLVLISIANYYKNINNLNMSHKYLKKVITLGSVKNFV